jgi:hypothetical protein
MRGGEDEDEDEEDDVPPPSLDDPLSLSFAFAFDSPMWTLSLGFGFDTDTDTDTIYISRSFGRCHFPCILFFSLFCFYLFFRLSTRARDPHPLIPFSLPSISRLPTSTPPGSGSALTRLRSGPNRVGVDDARVLRPRHPGAEADLKSRLRVGVIRFTRCGCPSVRLSQTPPTRLSPRPLYGYGSDDEGEATQRAGNARATRRR